MALRQALVLLALAASTAAPAATGLVTLPAAAGLGPVTLLYPTQAAPAALQRGPFTLQAAVDAAPAHGNGRLVVLSHGSGGSVWPQWDLAQALVAAGFTVAMPLHRGDNFEDTGDVGPVSWARRPQEVSQAIDAVATLAATGGRLAPLQLDLQRVGAYGMSAGGLTALALAGGRWSPARLAQHCEAHIEEDFPACVGLSTELTGGVLDGGKIAIARRVIRARLGEDTAWRSWTEPRIAAVVAAVPMAAPFDMASLAAPRVPLGLVRAGQDAWLAPRWHSDAVLAACAGRCTLVADLAQGGHGSILSPAVPGLSGALGRLLNDPPGFSRSSLPAVHQGIAGFFARQLGATARAQP
ncbi:MAG: dienelactone hydrolase [Pseudorhodoferax sp.]